MHTHKPSSKLAYGRTDLGWGGGGGGVVYAPQVKLFLEIDTLNSLFMFLIIS